MEALKRLTTFKRICGVGEILQYSIVKRSCSSNSQIISTDYIIRSPFPDIELPNQSIYRMLSENFSKFGSKTAIVDGLSGRKYSFNEIDESSYKVSSSLQRLGFDKGDVMCTVLPNCPECTIIYLGVFASGGVLSTCNHNFTANELAYQFNNSKAKIIATTSAHLSKVKEAAAKADVRNIVVVDDSQTLESSFNLISYQSLVKNSNPLLDPVETNVHDVALLPYSSGTTGPPKGVMLTNYNVCSNLRQMTHPEFFHFSDDPSVCLMGIAPFFHIYGIAHIVLSSLYCGFRFVSLPKFEPDTFLAAVEKYKVSFAHIVPPIVLFLAKHPLVAQYDMSSLRELVSAAAPVGSDIMSLAMQRTNAEVFRQIYGLTETGPVTHIMPHSFETRYPSSVGQPVRNMMVKVVDPETNNVLPPNTEGEIWVHGPNVMKGYLNNEAATQDCIVDNHWFKTGDIGYYDGNGLFYITDRLKELIKVKGFQVAPAELEAILLTHPKILDVAVVGIPHERLGEAPKAFVVKKTENFTEEEVQNFLVGKVTEHKYLAGGVDFIEAIPKSASGKILRRTLRIGGSTAFIAR